MIDTQLHSSCLCLTSLKGLQGWLACHDVSALPAPTHAQSNWQRCTIYPSLRSKILTHSCCCLMSPLSLQARTHAEQLAALRASLDEAQAAVQEAQRREVAIGGPNGPAHMLQENKELKVWVWVCHPPSLRSA